MTAGGRTEIIWIYALDGTRVAANRHGFFELYTDVRLDQSEQLIFQIAADHPKAGFIIEDAEIRFDGRQYFVSETNPERDNRSNLLLTVECDATWYRLGDTVYAGSLFLDGLTTSAGAAAIVEGTGWTVGTNTTGDATTFSLEAKDKSRLELLRKWASVTGKHLRFDTTARQVAFVDDAGIDSNVSYRYARNLEGMEKFVRPPEVTRVYPFGSDDLSIAGVNGGVPYLEDLTYYTGQGLTIDQARYYAREEVRYFRDFIREQDLLAGAQRWLNDRSSAEIRYKMRVVDLSGATGINETPNVGDTVRVFDPAIATGDLRPTCVRLVTHPLEPDRNEVELSTLYDPVSDTDSSSGRPSNVAQWQQFQGPIRADYRIRNDARYTVARIPLRFSEDGRANYYVDFVAVGVGAGVMVVELSDENNGDAIKGRGPVSIPYTDGQEIRFWQTFSASELSAQYNYRLRVSTIASGGPSTANGVNITQDPDSPEQQASFFIMAQNALQQSPTVSNSEVFNYTGAVQSFTVPDNVTEVTIDAKGAPGGGSTRGRGGTVLATIPVTPGAELDVYVGEIGLVSGGPVGAFPNGGAGGTGSGGNAGYGGGASSDVRPAGTSMASALVVAPGGGGSAEDQDAAGGDGGFFIGEDGTSPDVLFAAEGVGATQFNGGAGGLGAAGGSPGQAGDTTGQGDGGNAPNTSSALFYPPGGGGGGFHGGGSGGQDSFSGSGQARSGGGGGGAGFVIESGYDLELGDGVHDDYGQVVISWETPA